MDLNFPIKQTNEMKDFKPAFSCVNATSPMLDQAVSPLMEQNSANVKKKTVKNKYYIKI